MRALQEAFWNNAYKYHDNSFTPLKFYNFQLRQSVKISNKTA